MGYFSNGTEGDMYKAQHCAKCVHYADSTCPVLEIHTMLNHCQFPEHCKTPESKCEAQTAKTILDVLIPRAKNTRGCFNDQCVMFHEENEPGGGEA